MGVITDRLFEAMKIPHFPFPSEKAAVASALDAAEKVIAETSLPAAFIMEKESVRDDGLDPPARTLPAEGVFTDHRKNQHDPGERPTRAAILEHFLKLVPPNAPVIATTGKCGRELFTLDDRDQHLYQVGSMGCASAMGLGVALNVDRPVVVLDGDGAALMKMGALATIGAYSPANLVHILLDNGVHDSTGGQATVSASVDFAAVALACGYAKAMTCDSVDGFEAACATAFAGTGPSLIHMLIAPGSMSPLGRPTITPGDVARRFKAFLAS
jgi:phosphonopyruvate decarboxylase